MPDGRFGEPSAACGRIVDGKLNAGAAGCPGHGVDPAEAAGGATMLHYRALAPIAALAILAAAVVAAVLLRTDVPRAESCTAKVAAWEPLELIVVLDDSHDSLLLEWTSGPEDTTQWQYRQRHWDGENRNPSWGPWTDVPGSDADTRCHRVTGLQPDAAYEFQVRAIDIGGTTIAESLIDDPAGDTTYFLHNRGITHRQGDLPRRLGTLEIGEGDGHTDWQVRGFLFVIPEGTRLGLGYPWVNGAPASSASVWYPGGPGGLTFYSTGRVKKNVVPETPAHVEALLDQIIDSTIYLDIREGTRDEDPTLRVGDCLPAPPRMDFDAARAVPCSEDHSLEIIASFRYLTPAYPRTRLHEYTRDTCREEHFAEYMGAPYDRSHRGGAPGLDDVGTVVPAVEAWDTGDREILCYVVKAYNKRTGSVRAGK